MHRRAASLTSSVKDSTYDRAVRAARLVQLVLELQRRQGATAATLASELGVSVRTIYRDVEALGLAGVPTIAAQLGLGPLLVAAQAKVDAALPAELRQRSVRLRERFHAELPGWFERPVDVPALVPLSRAVWDGLRVEVRRHGREEPVLLDPLGLVVQGGTWYLVAIRADSRVDGAVGGRRPAPRSHRVDRIEAVQITAVRAERPASFDLARWWTEHRHDFDRSIRGLAVHVLVDPAVARRLARMLPGRLPEEIDEALAVTARPGEGSTEPVELVLQMESIEVAHAQLLPMAGNLTVLAPAELRRRLRDTASAIMARHRGRAPERHVRPASGG